jgi:hypothetical protein
LTVAAIRRARVASCFASITCLTCSRLCDGDSAANAAFAFALFASAAARSFGTVSVGSGWSSISRATRTSSPGATPAAAIVA